MLWIRGCGEWRRSGGVGCLVGGFDGYNCDHFDHNFGSDIDHFGGFVECRDGWMKWTLGSGRGMGYRMDGVGKVDHFDHNFDNFDHFDHNFDNFDHFGLAIDRIMPF